MGVRSAVDPVIPSKTRGIASDPRAWQPAPYRAFAPTNGVTLTPGLFKTAMENNIQYLLDSFSVSHMLVPFRERAGQTNPPDAKPQVAFWDLDLRGSSAGRFLMGAGNTLRWMDHPALRRSLNELMDGIEACRTESGYILAYPPDKTRSEEPNYGRAWFTHGLIEAAIAGNPKAYALLRGHADWFNHWDMLPKLIECCSNAHQGHIASTRTYFSAVGKPEDLQVAEKYYVLDWWIDQLTAREEKALWRFPLPTPHSYLITSFEAYLDHYRATGDVAFLNAMLGAWDLIHDRWEHVGGSMAICEGPAGSFPPGSYYLTPKGHTGETCGTVFWILFNQRFHLLYPEIEKYVSEIEKSIYNVALANQVGGKGIRYHALQEGRKEAPNMNNTCCEGQGTRLYGALPEYIYSVASDGLYVDLYEPSSITWSLRGQALRLKQTTEFPRHPGVSLSLELPEPAAFKLRVRVPFWASHAMPIYVNDQRVAMGHPGSYAVLERTWASGDRVVFTLPMDLRLTRYTGRDQIHGHERYAIEYGPIQLAAVGPLDPRLGILWIQSPEMVRNWLKPVQGQPLHFAIAGQPESQCLPYWEVSDQPFTCYPIIQPLAVRGSNVFFSSTAVEIVSNLAGTRIHYTLDGVEPTAQSPVYAGPITLTNSARVTARLFASNEVQSAVVASEFRQIPLFAPSLGVEAKSKRIELLLPPLAAGAGIYYTLDGNEPTERSPRYTEPFAVPGARCALRARAIGPDQARSAVVGVVVDPGAAPQWPAPEVHLSDLPTLSATVGWNTLKPNRNIVGKPLILAGVTYEKGLGVHATSDLVYSLKPEYKRFVALVGIDDDTQSKGSVSFEVYADGQMLYQTPIIRPPQMWRIEAPIPSGAKKLRLVVADGGDDYNYDWGDWVLAGFTSGEK